MLQWAREFLARIRGHRKTWPLVKISIAVAGASLAMLVSLMFPSEWVRFVANVVLAICMMLLFRVGFAARISEDFNDAISAKMEDPVKVLSKINRSVSRIIASYPKDLEKLRDAIPRPSDQILVHRGVSQVHANRSEAMKSFDSTIQSARDRVWLLGATLATDVRLPDILPNVYGSLGADSKKLRVLLGDPYRSPAVFRTLLESDRTLVDEIVKHYELSPADREKKDYNPLFVTPSMREFDNIFKMLIADGRFDLSVRFYAHLCSLWMIVVDNKILYQPIFLPAYHAAGFDIPTPSGAGVVFEVDASTPTDLSRSLLAHYELLWNTSDADMLHMRVRWKNKETIMNELFKLRSPWIKNCRDYFRRKWQRRGQRHICATSPPRGYTIQWMDGTKERSAIGTLVDYSSTGLAMSFDPAEVASLVPQIESAGKSGHKQELKVSINQEDESLPPTPQVIAERVIPASSVMFAVRASACEGKGGTLIGVTNELFDPRSGRAG